VAEYVLIDGYLDAFRTQVRWRKDVEDLVAEVEDHLYSTVERFEARGTDAQLAQRQTLDRFGDPDLMAEAFASTPTGGIAVPTKFTNTAGLAALAAAGLWLAAAATLWFASEVVNDWDGAFFIYIAFVVGASAMTLMTTAGLRGRLGGLGALGLAGLIIAGIGVAASLVVGWALPLWMTFQGVGYLFVALAVWPMRVAPRLPMIGYGSGFLLGSVTFTIVRVLEVGSIDQWGDYPLAYQIGGTVGFVIIAAGLFGIGHWLRNEEPTDIDIPDQAISA
jgi:hypothetical protein